MTEAANPAASDRRLIGSVEVPNWFDLPSTEILTPVPGAIPLNERGATALREAPNTEARVRVQLRAEEARESVTWLMHGYDELSAEVYDVRNGWFLLRYTQNGKQAEGWLSPNDAGAFRPLSSLLLGRMSYLTPDWDGILYEKPDPSAHFEKLKDRIERQDVNVNDHVVREGKDWFLVDVLEPGRCEKSPEILRSGWIVAFSRSDKPQVWFYPRGC
ncbi:MAG TPA: hypothetical protein VFY29_04475 [Terriglobia bacterium]|nr:hypothetical protein [Terriglobia bacterium]